MTGASLIGTIGSRINDRLNMEIRKYRNVVTTEIQYPRRRIR